MTLLWRSELRRGWRGLVALAVLVAVVGAVVLAALAGARRTATSYDRFIETSRNQDVLVFATDMRPADIAKLRTRPGVETIGPARALALLAHGDFLAAGGPTDGVLIHGVDRLRIVAGREADPGAPDELVIGEPLARRLGLDVGDRLELQSFTPSQMAAAAAGAELGRTAGPTVRLTIVGISRSPVDLSLQGTDGGIVLTTRAFVTKYGDRIGNFSGPHGKVVFARLTDGSGGVPRFLRQLRAVLGDRSFDVDPAALSTGGVQQSIDLLALAVLGLGLVAGLAGTIALTMIVGRQITSAAVRQRPTRDLGLTRPRRALAAAGPTALGVAIGVGGGVVGSWLASPLFPFGVAAEAEPDPGLHLDPLAVLGAAAVWFVVLAAIVTVAAWRATHLAPAVARKRTSRLVRLLDAGSWSAPASIGVRLALDPGRGRTTVPVRSSLFGTAFAVFGVVTVVVFGASLTGLGADPHAFGRSWDVTIIEDRRSSAEEMQLCGRVDAKVRADPAIAALGNVCNLNVTVAGRAVGAYAIAPIRGMIGPTIVSGRAPHAADEVALGTETLAALHREIGDQVAVRSPGHARRYRIVGQAVVPSMRDPQAVADGAVFAPAGLSRLDSPAGSTGFTSAIVARFRDGVDQRAAISRLRNTPGIGSAFDAGVVRSSTPLEVHRLAQIDRVPVILGSFLAIVGTIAVAHLLVTSVQRRRRDFAVLKSIGFTRGQVARAVSWQATVVALIGAAAGTAAGLVAGTLLWRAAAERVGVLAVVDVPTSAIIAIVIAVLLVANLAAAWPARSAARIEPAIALRSE